MSVTILQGDVRAMLATLPDESVQCVVTSPPYFALRSYLPADHPDKAREIGSEPTPADFIAALIAVFDEVKRVLRRDGLCFINLGDSYAGSGKGPSSQNGITLQHSAVGSLIGPTPIIDGIPAKNLLLIPERFAIAMQDRGWWVRQHIVWAKKAPMPESVKDRFTRSWESIWMFAKSRTYYFDQEAIRQPNTDGSAARHSGPPEQPWAEYRGSATIPPGHPATAHPTKHHNGGINRNGGANGANMRDVWHLGPSPLTEAHFATFPPEIPRRCILAGTSKAGACVECGAPRVRVVERGERVATSERGRHGYNLAKLEDTGLVAMSNKARDGIMPGQAYERSTTGWAPSCAHLDAETRPCVVLDPFLGSGTTAMVADRLGRDAIDIELSPIYARMAEERLKRDAGPMFSEPVTVEAPTQMSMLEAM